MSRTAFFAVFLFCRISPRCRVPP